MAPPSPLGYTHLTVTNLKRSVIFYQSVLGMHVQREDSISVSLGTVESTLLVLTENPHAHHPGRSTGLYHFALRLPSRSHLAEIVMHLIDTQTPVQGVSDHGVSEAIYLPDPDGNGIEIYHDRPKADWFDTAGELIITTQPLDLDNLLAIQKIDFNGWQIMPAGTILGHMHLHVAELDPSTHFYRDILGMDLVAEYGNSARFFSWGGYHHHLGINTWNGIGASTPPENSLGLRFFTFELSGEQVEDIQTRLDAADHLASRDHGGLFIRDPSGNGLVVRTRP